MDKWDRVRSKREGENTGRVVGSAAILFSSSSVIQHVATNLHGVDAALAVGGHAIPEHVHLYTFVCGGCEVRQDGTRKDSLWSHQGPAGRDAVLLPLSLIIVNTRTHVPARWTPARTCYTPSHPSSATHPYRKHTYMCMHSTHLYRQMYHEQAYMHMHMHALHVSIYIYERNAPARWSPARRT